MNRTIPPRFARLIFNRRLAGVPALLAALLVFSAAGPAEEPEKARAFRVWSVSDAHVPSDIKHGRESLGQAIRQSEGFEEDAPGFDWDIMIDSGDLSASQYPPTDEDGCVLVRQYRRLRKHYREDVYQVSGNHDGDYYDHGVLGWFAKWADPLGQHTEFSGVRPEHRRFPVDGTAERYKFQAGNVLFLMMSDYNAAPSPVGRGHSSQANRGGFPAGAVTRATFNWWKEQVLENQDKIIISAHHHVLRDTTTRSGYGEGEGFHGSSGGVEGSSYLYFTVENPSAEHFEYTTSTPNHPGPFEVFLEQFHQQHGRPAIDLWVGAHSHAMTPEQVFNGKGLVEEKWGVTFLQTSGLTVHHAGGIPISRLLTFTQGSDRLRIALYVHEDASDRGYPLGWYEPAETSRPLRGPFKAPPPDRRGPPPEPVPLAPLCEPEPLEPVPPGGTLEVSDHPRWTERAKGRAAIEFDRSAAGLALGLLPMDDWTGLTVRARVATTRKGASMRVVSKDRIGQPGNFVLSYDGSAWEFRVFDDKKDAWSRARWESTAINDGRPHHLAGVADSRQGKVLLYADGALRAEGRWTATTLDDSDKTWLAVGTDSREVGGGRVFDGTIAEVRLDRRALSADEIRRMAASP